MRQTHLIATLTGCSALNIDINCANGPQAKGRIEWAFGTLQDRMVKELRLAHKRSVQGRFDSFIQGHPNRGKAAAQTRPMQRARSVSRGRGCGGGA